MLFFLKNEEYVPELLKKKQSGAFLKINREQFFWILFDFLNFTIWDFNPYNSQFVKSSQWFHQTMKTRDCFVTHKFSPKDTEDSVRAEWSLKIKRLLNPSFSFRIAFQDFETFYSFYSCFMFKKRFTIFFAHYVENRHY